MSGTILNYFRPKGKDKSSGAESPSTPKRPLSSSISSSPLAAHSPKRPLSSISSPLSAHSPKRPLSSISSSLAVHSPKRPLSESPVPSPKRPKASLNESVSSPKGKSSVLESDDYIHLSLDFLRPEKRRDRNGRQAGSPGFLEDSLLVPESFMNSVTPAQRQWWTLKSEHFRDILMFKMGKFYEVFHMDALLVTRECDLSMMKGEVAHCGFPEVSFHRYTEMLVAKGHSVLRIEQTETPEGLDKRLKAKKANTKWDKVVRREVCQRISPGTQNSDGSSGEAQLLVGLFVRDGVVGLCAVDCTAGTLQFGQWAEEQDGFTQTQLALAKINPAEFLLESEDSRLHAHIETRFPSVRRILLKPPSPEETLKKIASADYFPSTEEWPSALQDLCVLGDKPKPKSGFEASLSSLGAVIAYLSESMIDFGILAQGKMEAFSPTARSTQRGGSMILDDASLYNLDVLPKGKKSQSLLSILDSTATPFGRRLLKQWVTVPLFNPKDILRRQEAVAELSGGAEPGSLSKSYIADLKGLFRRLPDFERLTGLIASNGLGFPPGHPEHRAVYMDASILSKRKLNKFLDCLGGFKLAHNGLKSLVGKHEFRSGLLVELLVDSYPLSELDEVLGSFDASLDISAAAKSGQILPSKGMDPEYDEILSEKQSLEADTQKYLSKLKKLFRHETIKFFGTGKNAFQIEVPAEVRVGEDFEFTSRRKGFNRYASETSKSFLERRTKLNEREASVLDSSSARIYAKFSSHADLWGQLIGALSSLDALLSLAVYSYTSIEGSFPEILEEGRVLSYTDGVHPILQQIGSSYIPNDLDMSSGSTLVLTGANMGGKSSLMRQTALLAILAQIGGRVPATSMRLSPVDRVFTRVGASDNIFGGESTFLVELSETSAILRGMSDASFVLIDELGRGTTTYDGMSLAFSTLRHLAGLGGRVMFSTHYHRIMAGAGDIPIYHMSFQEDSDDEITFLYKLVPGACPKSHGFNTARLAGIPDDVVENGLKSSREYEMKESVLDSLVDALRDAF